jgi:hypothetical protein
METRDTYHGYDYLSISHWLTMYCEQNHFTKTWSNSISSLTQIVAFVFLGSSWDDKGTILQAVDSLITVTQISIFSRLSS